MKEGYKQTKLGIIPDAWEIKKFIDFSDKSKKWSFTGGPFGSDLKSSDYTEDGIRIIQLQNIGDGRFIDNYKIYTSSTKADQLLSCNIYPGDIILSKMGDPVARACFIPSSEDRFVMSSDGIRLSVDENIFDKKFVHDYINSIYFRRRAIDVSTGSTRQRIGLPTLKNLDIIYPPLEEQKAIADCLSTWDKAIELQRQLILSKEARKKALAQQLLTGKRRLPGFTDEWKESKLGELFKERNETRREDLNLLSIGQQGVYPQSESNKRDISNVDKSKYRRITPGDIGYNTMRMWQGRSALSDLEGIVSPAYTILIPNKNVNSYFFSILFKMGNMTNLFWRNSQGLVDDTLNCKYKDFSIIKCEYPSIEEQNSIEKILKKADQEIQLEKKKLSDLEQQKKALMQQLLTGKVRLV